MKLKNTHNAVLNLESGSCKPGQVAECTYSESKLLLQQGRCEITNDSPVKEDKPKV